MEFSDAAVPSLGDAFDAGVTFAPNSHRRPRGRQHRSTARPRGLAGEWRAEMIVVQLRRRLDTGEDAGEDPCRHVRSAYREWARGTRQRLVGDVSLGAFSLGGAPPAGGAAGALVAGGAGPAVPTATTTPWPVGGPGGHEFPTGPPPSTGPPRLSVPARPDTCVTRRATRRPRRWATPQAPPMPRPAACRGRGRARWSLAAAWWCRSSS